MNVFWGLLFGLYIDVWGHTYIIMLYSLQVVKGDWANYQIAFIPDSKDRVVGVAYTLYTGMASREHKHSKQLRCGSD